MVDIKNNRQKKIKLILFFITLIFILFSVFPLFKPGFYEIHDQTHFERLYEMDKCLKLGQIPCRIAPDLAFGYGYPIFNFYAPLPYYFGELFHLLGFNFIDSIKAVFILAVIIGWLGMFLLSKEFFGFYAGLVSGLIYVYTPYRAINLYIRGALSESLALGLIPLVVYFLIKLVCHCEPEPASWRVEGKAISKLSKKPTGFLPRCNTGVGMIGKNKWLFLSGLFYALLILSHNLTSLIFSVFLLSSLLIYSWYLLKTKKSLLNVKCLMFPIIIGLLISCFFWLPAILEKPLVNTESMTRGILDYHLHFPKISQLIYSKWTYGGSGANVGISAEDMSFQLGILNWLAIPLSLFMIVKLWKKNRDLSSVLFLAACYLLLVAFLITSKSRFLWDLIPSMAYIQFPWRFLGWTTLFSSFLAGSLFLLSKKSSHNYILLLIVICLIFCANFRYFRPKSQFTIDEKSYLTDRISSGTTGVTDEYYPKWVKIKPAKKAENLIEIINADVGITNLSTNFFKTEFNYSAKQRTKVLVNYIYYPGFKVSVNNKEVPVDFSNDKGLISFNIEKGQGKIKIIFMETPLRKIIDLLSLASFIILLFTLLKSKLL